MIDCHSSSPLACVVPIRCKSSTVFPLSATARKQRSIPAGFPYLFNDHGLAQPSVQVRGNLIQLSPENPSLSLGTRYSGISWRDREVPTNTGSYWIKTFDFHASEVHYAPIWATRKRRKPSA